MSDSSTADHATGDVWVKRSASAPQGFFATEAAGLRWLAAADALPVVEVLDVAAQEVTLARLRSVEPTPAAAREFGTGLGRLHSVSASAFGELPPGAVHYFFGPLEAPLSLPTTTSADFGTFYAANRLEPLMQWCRADGSLTSADVDLMTRICQGLRDGAAPHARPARIHGDLWSGNVMWTPEGATLIDPAACGHHPLADLAMLEMFRFPHLDDVLVGYEQTRPLPGGWRDAMGLHQLFGYLVHLHLFGTTYRPATLRAARSAADYLGQ